MNGANDPKHDDVFRNIEVIRKIKRLKDVAVASLASRSGVSCGVNFLNALVCEMRNESNLTL